jgi:nicotinamide-nucleotide amidase
LTITFEVLCIGYELLWGSTRNTNAEWISTKIGQTGGLLIRITIIGDNIDHIALAIKESLTRKPNWIIITGGLGPTYDDKTLEGLAIALGVDLSLSDIAIEMLKKSYLRNTSNFELNETRLKMARVPNGSFLIQNNVGIAPCVILDIQNGESATMIVCLPGVPREMQSIFNESILPMIKEKIGEFFVIERNYEIIGLSEVILNPVLSSMVNTNPPNSIYVKTHPQGITNNNLPKLKMQIISKGKNKSEVQFRYNNIINKILREVNRLNGKIWPTEVSQL